MLLILIISQFHALYLFSVLLCIWKCPSYLVLDKIKRKNRKKENPVDIKEVESLRSYSKSFLFIRESKNYIGKDIKNVNKNFKHKIIEGGNF